MYAALLIASVGVAVSAAEELYRLDVFSDSGILSWSVLRFTRRRARLRSVQELADLLFRPRAFAALLVAKLAAGLSVVALTIAGSPPRPLLAALSAAVLALVLLMKRRTTFGLDGSDHMQVVVFLGATAFLVVPQDSLAATAAVLYVAAQAVLAYVVAGVAKLAGPAWRDGSALGGIMTTKIYGTRWVGEFLTGRPLLGLAACWAVILFEMGFVAVLFVDQRAMWGLLAVGVLFHASTAVLMGLNGFLLAFTATYPAVAYAHHLLHAGWL
ncbi:hypothetical protein [Mycolicibacterium austroafricanum]|jgi:hypothetical protein|uniref:HTTM-like domain-containing protein n=1 Tax=Mycolicibacterium austroafricanum TaxID=39687 RepID=A0ABT8HLJ4_MYCAO|nr:hypothetical protein [Mycolicibacterium austroafricanum]MDN4521631.1 hypothetical protein [Mycolicibacterium austroafricanum]QRZ09336.1 hypothetical protein JN090_13025 [Mycolicibacterium austroafricanum]QZT70453.1 hypothetical protein JN086_10950 [Mycolicibacterium austroafricanum]QZY48767.1 hypothetical protein K5L12_14400 [Mycolicibacterium austroafricanum]